jgi:hypothetical protein
MGLESGSIATAIGISGFVLGFAFKDILSHFLAGLMLLIGGKFRIGDQIVVREFEGTVERIELRALQLRTYDNRVVVIPNADVFTSAVTSNTASPHRRRAFTVGIGYDDDIDRAQRVALETVCATPGVLEEPNPDVTVDELAPSTVNLRVRFSVNSLRADYVSVGGECMKRVKLAFDREGISMPTNIQTVVIKNLDERLARLEEILSAATENASDRHIEDIARRIVKRIITAHAGKDEYSHGLVSEAGASRRDRRTHAPDVFAVDLLDRHEPLVARGHLARGRDRHRFHPRSLWLRATA